MEADGIFFGSEDIPVFVPGADTFSPRASGRSAIRANPRPSAVSKNPRKSAGSAGKKFVRADFEEATSKRAWSHVASPPENFSLTSFDFAVFLCALASWREKSRGSNFEGKRDARPPVKDFFLFCSFPVQKIDVAVLLCVLAGEFPRK